MAAVYRERHRRLSAGRCDPQRPAPGLSGTQRLPGAAGELSMNANLPGSPTAGPEGDRIVSVIEWFAQCGSLAMAEQLYRLASRPAGRSVAWLLARGVPRSTAVRSIAVAPDADAVPLAGSLPPSARRSTTVSLIIAAAIHESRGQFAHAAPLYLRAARACRGRPRLQAWQLVNLGRLYDRQARFERALRCFRLAAETGGLSTGPEFAISVDINIAIASLGMDRIDDACGLWLACVDRLADVHGRDHVLVRELVLACASKRGSDAATNMARRVDVGNRQTTPQSAQCPQQRSGCA